MTHTTIIAEAGVNHNGDPEMALRLIRAAADAGADAIKFQTFRAEKVVSPDADKAAYQKTTTGSDETQAAMLRALELAPSAHAPLIAEAERCGINFLSTAFDIESLDFLLGCGMRQIKVPSGELTNLPFLVAIGKRQCPVILSTGMATIAEVREAIGALVFGMDGGAGSAAGPAAFASAFAAAMSAGHIASRIRLLHCTTEYPCPFEDVNLRAMDTLAQTFGVEVGLSDHSPGIAVPIAAVARGATIIEKHVTLDRSLPGPDHQASIEPDQLKAMVRAIRAVELALGGPDKGPSPSELKNIPIARRSLAAACPIGAGEPFTETNLTALRPGSGVHPREFWTYLGRNARRAYAPGELIEPPCTD